MTSPDGFRCSPNLLEASLMYYNRARNERLPYDLDGALSDLNTALQLDPEYGDAYLLRGHVWFAMRNYENAIQDFKLCATVPVPGNVFEAYLALGFAHARLLDYQAARDWFSLAKGKAPDYAMPYVEYHLALATTDSLQTSG